EVSPLLANVPSGVDDFIDWFEELKRTGPGQGDELFPWLAQNASRKDMLWFLTQEVAGEAGFDDLLAMTQVKMPVTAKLEMARNYWDEMGRGRDTAMHGPLLERLANYLDIDAKPEHVIPESLALGNAMLALARSRRYCFQSIGALGVIEMTAPTRACFIDAGLKRLRIPTKKRLYFTLHADLAAIYLRLVEDRHDFKVFIGNPLCHDTLAGLTDRVTDWRAELDWVRSAGTEGCILFE